MSHELAVWLEGTLTGRLTRRQGRVAFSYDADYRRRVGAAPLSWSMPLAQADHTPAAVEPWLDNLLPDSDTVRARWADGLGLVRPTVFDLLARVGEDCPGAVQIVAPDRAPDQSGDREPVPEETVAAEIRRLRIGGSDGWSPDPAGQWSLGGAQPKLALGQGEDGAWHRPTGRAASTHIIKVGFTSRADSDWAEHVTSKLAARLGLAVAATEMRRFGDERAVVVRRFDRLRVDGAVRRLHQEDFCQALGLWRHAKYESVGGPGAARLAGLVGQAVEPRHVESDRLDLARAIVFNWVAACPDAHAKNYAFLHTGASPRLAPLFDLASASLLWPPNQVEYSGRLAMAMGGQFQLFAIRRSHLSSAAADLGVGQDWFLGEAQRQAGGLMGALEAVLDTEPDLDPAVAERFHSGLAARVAALTRTLGG